MAYSLDLRERVIAHIQKGHTLKETSETFSVGISTIKRWKSLLSETGGLEKRPLNRSARIYDSEKLNTYMEENSDALLKDVAEHFGGSVTGAFNALKREKITLKKEPFLRKETRKNAGNSRKTWPKYLRKRMWFTSMKAVSRKK